MLRHLHVIRLTYVAFRLFKGYKPVQRRADFSHRALHMNLSLDRAARLSLESSAQRLMGFVPPFFSRQGRD